MCALFDVKQCKEYIDFNVKFKNLNINKYYNTNNIEYYFSINNLNNIYKKYLNIELLFNI